MPPNVVAALRTLVAYRDPDECHALQTSDFDRYLAMCSLGTLAELAVRQLPSERVYRTVVETLRNARGSHDAACSDDDCNGCP